MCAGVVTSAIPLHFLHLEDNVHVQWSDKYGPLQNLENSTVTDVSLRNGVLQSTLLFHPLSPGHDRLFTCSMMLDIPHYSTSSDNSKHRVIIGKNCSFFPPIPNYISDAQFHIDAAYFQIRFSAVTSFTNEVYMIFSYITHSS